MNSFLPRRTFRFLTRLVLLSGFASLWFGCEMEGGHKIAEKMQRESQTREERDSLWTQADLERLYAQFRTVSHWDSVRQDSFHIEDRRPSIQRFPCSQCHMETGKAVGERDAHFGVEINHAGAATMNCATCHGTQMGHDSLASLTGESIAFEKAFQLCGQCHSKQLDDFMGGAHGKRLGGWGGPRLVKNCTGCHNPHDPQWKKRWPATSATRRGEP